MAFTTHISTNTLIICVLALVLIQASPAAAFGAGNIASISSIEGHNWRHGDIEDMIKTIAFLKGRKWTNMMVKRVYFGNWLRDYSQAMDVGTLKGVPSDTIRILVWMLSFLGFGYATMEFEVTQERLGVYRPEEHIDNPKGYADNADARKFDPRLRPPVQQIELDIDPMTGMKNYIANEKVGIATSSGYIKFSFSRSIHYGRLYTSGAGMSGGQEADLCEALRCLGQGLHTMEDWGAHTNYTELALIEMGHRNVFPHVGSSTQINLKGHRVWPLVTGTFGVVDFLHSVLGEATDHFAQSEVEQMDLAFKAAENTSKPSGGGTRAIGDEGPSGLSNMTEMLGQVPGSGDFVQEAQNLQAMSDQQRLANENQAKADAASGAPPSSNTSGTALDPAKVVRQIYPILVFRDKVAKAISATIEKIPGLEALVEKITETLTLFVLSLLAPFIRPIINAVSKQLKAGSGGVIDASGRSQYEPWTDPHCSDPTHSLLSKDHFSNILNPPAGSVAAVILQYVAPRIVYAWEHPDVPVDQVLNDVVRVFHHPAARDRNCEIHRNMYHAVEQWVRSRPDGGANLDHLLGSDSVRNGKNHTVDPHKPAQQGGGHMPAGLPNIPGMPQMPHIPHMPNMPNIPHMPKVPGLPSGLSSLLNSGSKLVQTGKFRGIDESEVGGDDAPESVFSTFPGMRTSYDDSREKPDSQASYGAQPQPSGDPYGQAPYPQGQQYGQQPPEWQQYPGQAPPGAGYPPQGGYGGGPQYGYNPNAPPQQGYGNPGPPQPPYYGQNPPY